MKVKNLLIIFFLFLNLNINANQSINENEIHKNLRCLVCQGQSISDSNSDFAQTIKLVVKDLIKQGKSEQEIYSFMADKYGDWIVYKPEFNKQNFMLWFLPYFILLGGGFIIFHKNGICFWYLLIVLIDIQKKKRHKNSNSNPICIYLRIMIFGITIFVER